MAELAVHHTGAELPLVEVAVVGWLCALRSDRTRAAYRTDLWLKAHGRHGGGDCGAWMGLELLRIRLCKARFWGHRKVQPGP